MFKVKLNLMTDLHSQRIAILIIILNYYIKESILKMRNKVWRISTNGKNPDLIAQQNAQYERNKIFIAFEHPPKTEQKNNTALRSFPFTKNR